MGAARLLQYSESIRMMTESCCECGVIFAMPESLQQEFLKNHRSFYCPNGHGQSYTGESDKDKAARLQKELEAAQGAKRFAEARLADEQIRHSAEMARIRKRQAAGVCPCCHRTVSQMARHMKTKHPDYGELNVR